MITLRIEGVDVHVRAPVGCQSFFNPTAGVRVTRNSGERFVLTTSLNRLELIEFSYSCSELDAKITLSPSVLVHFSRAQRSPSPEITADVAVPIEHPGAKFAQIVLIEAKLDISDSASNVVAVESVKDELKKFFNDTVDLRFASVDATFLPVPGQFVTYEDTKELLNFKESTFVSPDAQRRVAKLLPKFSLILETDNPQFDRALESIGFKYLPDESVFVPIGRSGGRRTYYPVSSDRCEKQYQFCLTKMTKARIGGYDFDFNLRMVYDPGTQGVYHFGIMWF